MYEKTKVIMKPGRLGPGHPTSRASQGGRELRDSWLAETALAGLLLVS
jgi:hypothetical protein